MADLILVLHEERGVGYDKLARWFGVGRSTVRDICGYRIWLSVSD